MLLYEIKKGDYNMIEEKGYGRGLLEIMYPSIIKDLLVFCEKVDDNRYVTDLIDEDTLLSYRDLAYIYSEKQLQENNDKNENIPLVHYVILKLNELVDAANACDIGWNTVTNGVAPVTIETDEFFVSTRKFIDDRNQTFRKRLSMINDVKCFNNQPFELEDGVEFLTIGECLEYYKELRKQSKKRSK